MNTQRAQSPAPPPPPKDTSNCISSRHPTFPSDSQSRYVNADLAEAVRDSVHIGSGPRPTSQTSLVPPLLALEKIKPSFIPPQPRRTPSPLPPGAAESSQPSHGYSKSSPDMSSMMQPQLPSQRMGVQNPFEQDEVEPTGTGRIRAPGGTSGTLGIEGSGVMPSSRTKFSRATTG